MTIRFCPECGTPRVEGSAACSNCGHLFAAQAAASNKEGPVAKPIWRDWRVMLAGGAAVAAGIGVFLWSNGTFSGSGVAAQVGKEERVAYDLNLMPVNFGGKCGYVDSKGKLVINPQFDQATYFIRSVDLAPVSIGGKWGLINRKGEYVVSPQFDALHGDSSPVVFWAKVGRQWGTINKTGAFVINPQFISISAFDAQGRAVVSTGEKSGVIDREGDFKIAPQFDWISIHVLPDGAIRIFDQGLAPARVNDKWGYIDETGQWAVNPQFSAIQSFDESGLAAVQMITYRDYTYDDGYGNQIPQREEISRWGYIDKTGKLVINPQFEYAQSFDGAEIAAVRTGDLWGYIDKKGVYTINPQFAAGMPFKKTKAGMLARVVTQSNPGTSQQMGLIDTTGAFKITPQFEEMGDFDRNGRAVVSVGSSKGMIDETGKLVVNPIYEWLSLMSGGDEYLYRKSAGPTAAEGVKEIGRMDRNGKILSVVRGAPCG